MMWFLNDLKGIKCGEIDLAYLIHNSTNTLVWQHTNLGGRVYNDYNTATHYY